MLKNSVLKKDVDTVKWLKAAGVRAVKTMAQAALAGIGTSGSDLDPDIGCWYSGSGGRG